MRSKRIAIVSPSPVLIAFMATYAIAAGDTANLVVQLGRDTTSVESYTRTENRVEVDQCGRSPRLQRRHFVYDYANGSLTHFSMVVTPPGETTSTQVVEITFDADSMRTETRTLGQPVKRSTLAWPPGTFLVPSASPWSGYETQVMKLVQSKSDSLVGRMHYLGAPSALRIRFRKQADGLVNATNELGDVFEARVDKSGHILAIKPIAGTAQFTVNRVGALDVGAMAASFLVREKAGKGLGVLSPRDTVEVASGGGATLWVDYGRPRKRGRVVFGGVVPFGSVWRTGANAATQFKTDKALDFGGTVVPAGFYTLWTVPSSVGWKLIVNSETGQWGTAHNSEKDLYTIDMKMTALAQAVEQFTISVEPTSGGGILKLDWDTTRASAPFVVRP
jgi:hypothetical protein